MKPRKTSWRASTPGIAPDRKTLQLCRQVERTLSMVLGDAGEDELLLSLRVVSVVPAPNASQLLVTVEDLAAGLPAESSHQPASEPVNPGTSDVDRPARIMACLAAHTGRLRYEVGQAIARRKVPQLLFRLSDNRPADHGMESDGP